MAQPGLLDTGDPNAYRSGLQSSFNVMPGKVSSGAWDRGNAGAGYNWDSTSPYTGNLSDDPDVAQSKNIANIEQAGRRGEVPGISYNEQDALLNQLKARINAKNNLGGYIAGAQGNLNSQLSNDQYLANHSLGEGLRSTRENYANRGALYSDSRIGAEQSLRNQVSNQLKGSMAADTSEAQGAVNKAREQYASVDLNTEQQNLQLASQAIDVGVQNQVARAQAMQQLGTGLGYAAGTVAGAYAYTPQPAQNPVAGWQPEHLDTPGLLGGPPQGSGLYGNAPQWTNTNSPWPYQGAPSDAQTYYDWRR